MRTHLVKRGVARATPHPLTRRAGFTLIELLVVIFITGIMGAMGVVNYLAWQRNEQFREAQRTLVDTINQARSQARRLSQDQTVSWVVENGKTTVTLGDQVTEIENLTIGPNATGNIVFTAPFGRRTSVARENLLLQGKGERTARLRIYGVTGKTQLTSCKGSDDTTC